MGGKVVIQDNGGSIELGVGSGLRSSVVGAGGTMDWKIQSGKKTGKVAIQNGGGTIELLGGGAAQTSQIGVGKTQDWFIRSGNIAGSVNIQDKGGPTNIGGTLTVGKDIKVAGHLFLTKSATTETMTLESRLMEMETKMQSLMETNMRLE